MRRLLQLLLLVFLVTASTTGVRASTDCERWFIAYKQELAHTKSVQRIKAAKLRAKRYAQRKLTGYVKPKPVTPKPKLVHVARRPPMSRAETLRHFNLACGVLPEDVADQPLVSEEEPPEEFAPSHVLDAALGTIPVFDNGLLPVNDMPPFSGGGDGGSGGGPPVYYPPFGGGGGGGGGGTPPGTPGDPGTPGVPVVPEPSSYVLMLTGLVAAAGVVRGRFKG